MSVPFTFRTPQTEADWNNAVMANDFKAHKTSRNPVPPTCLRILRTRSRLFFNIFCFEPDKTPLRAPYNREDGFGVWDDGGGVIELFFGGLEPLAWCLQLAVSAGGARYDSKKTYDLWSAKVTILPNGWRVIASIPFAMLRTTDLSIGFNLCRQNRFRGEVSSWSQLKHTFYELENFGELLFTDYNTAFFAKTGVLPAAELTRKAYEKKLLSVSTSATAIAHGPWLSNPSDNSMTISWATAGLADAMVEYREKGTSEWKLNNLLNGGGLFQRDDKLHVAHLTRLQPATEYEYRLVNIATVSKHAVRVPDSGHWSFKTFGRNEKSFSFAVCSDIHSDWLALEKILTLPEIGKTQFFVHLGDMLSCLSGRDAFYDGFLDMESRLYARTRPLVFVRGNHEQSGLFAGDYLKVLNHPSGKTYYAFRQGNVCFLVLDTGNNKPNDLANVRYNSRMIKEERLWLNKVVESEMYRSAKFRMAFLHMPPNNELAFDSKRCIRLMDGIVTQEKNRMIHLMLNGHRHSYLRVNRFSKNYSRLRTRKNITRLKVPPALPEVPFTFIANDIDSAMIVHAGADSLDVKVITGEGEMLDSFSIFEDGSWKDGSFKPDLNMDFNTPSIK